MKINTWLPGFSGFYGSLWEDCGEENEIYSINEQRKEKGLSPITYDDCVFDYKSFYETLSRDIADTIGMYLEKLKFIKRYKYESLQSPRAYNFSNDSINVEFTVTRENQKNIKQFLKENEKAFKEYLKARYTSCSGFISHYSNDLAEWTVTEVLGHPHKSGAILDFILRTQLENEDGEKNIDDWLYDQSESNYIYASNYQNLIGG